MLTRFIGNQGLSFEMSVSGSHLGRRIRDRYDWKAEQKGYTNSTAVAYTMFMDCEDKLAFVMIEQDSAMEPILIYSNGGTLIATSYMWATDVRF